MKNKFLQLQQLNQKMLGFALLQHSVIPPVGWVRAIRTALGMSMEQLGKKLAISKQAIMDMEKREQEGAISIRTLKDFAKALDMELVYGFVPKDGSLDALIEKRASILATQIVKRTSNTMKLEDQENSEERLQKAIQERAAIIKKETPKLLWD